MVLFVLFVYLFLYVLRCVCVCGLRKKGNFFFLLTMEWRA